MPTPPNSLGSKRECPKCAAKFFDMGANPIICPKCTHNFKPVAPSKPKPPKKIMPPKAKKPVKSLLVDDDEVLSPENFEEGAEPIVGELEDMDELDNAPEVISLEEVEEHQEEEEVDPNSDDAEEGMFLENLEDGGELFDDLAQDEESDEDEESRDDGNDDDEDDDENDNFRSRVTRKKKQ